MHTNCKFDERVYDVGWGWGVFDSCSRGFEIERDDENCGPRSGPNYMSDRDAEWLVMFLAADGDIDAINAMADVEHVHV